MTALFSQVSRGRRCQYAAAAMLAVGALAAPAAHAQTVFNFDTTSGGAPTTIGATINSQYPGAGVTFTGNAVIKQGGGGVTSLPNFASSTNFADSVTAVFDGTANFVSAQNVTNSSFTLSAFDINNILLGSVFVDGFSGVGAVTVAQAMPFSAPPVKSRASRSRQPYSTASTISASNRLTSPIRSRNRARLSAAAF